MARTSWLFFSPGCWSAIPARRVGDTRAPYKPEIKRFHGALAQLAEIAVFVGLGLTIELGSLTSRAIWLGGLLLALVLAFVVRPLVVAPMLLLYDLRRGERVFIAWSGLKGAVPILLGTVALLGGAEGAHRIYGVIFVVVAFSVIVQGSLLPAVAHRFDVPVRQTEPEPWSVSIRLREEPHGILRLVVDEGARACGKAIGDLPLGDRVWVALVLREGQPLDARASQTLEPGDEVLILAEADATRALHALFQGRRPTSAASGRSLPAGTRLLEQGAAATRRIRRLATLSSSNDGSNEGASLGQTEDGG